MSDRDSKELEEIGYTPEGYTLFRRRNEVGGYEYWSDEIGGGVLVWDTSLVNLGSLLAAITAEHARRFQEAIARKKPFDEEPSRDQG